MRRWSVRIVLILGVSLGLLSACGGGDEGTDDQATSVVDSTLATVDQVVPTTDASITAAPTTTEAPAQELELIGLGEFAVGVTTVTIDEDTDRPLTVDVWFPIDEETDRTKAQYTFLPGIFYRSPNAVDATFDEISPDGPFPLILYSHGSGGQRFIHSNYTETLAIHGHIVISANHTGNTLVESLVGGRGDLVSSASARLGDIDILLDVVLVT